MVIHVSVCLYFCFQMITWVNVNGFSPNLVYALILWRSGMELLMVKFHQFLTELPSCDTVLAGYYRFTFLYDHLYFYQYIVIILLSHVGLCKQYRPMILIRIYDVAIAECKWLMFYSAEEDKLSLAELFKGRSVNRNKRRFSFKTREDGVSRG